MSSGGLYNVPRGKEGLNTTDAKHYNGKASYAYAKRGIRSYVTHPGCTKTPGVKTGMPVLTRFKTFYYARHYRVQTRRYG